MTLKINEVSKRCNISQDTLRYYEKVGLIGPIKKSKSGIREYSEIDINRIEFVKCMRGADMPIDNLVKYMKLYDMGDSTIKERKNLLLAQRENLENKMQNMKKAYDKLNYKIELYNKQELEINLNKK